MTRFTLVLALTATAAFGATPPPAPAPRPERVIGTVQPEIRLSDGRLFRNTKVLDAQLDKGSATLSDGRRIRTVPLASLPDTLRQQVVAELSQEDRPRYNIYRREVRPPPPADQFVTPAPPLQPPVTPTVTDQLIAQATAEAPAELKLHLLKQDQRVASVTTKIRKAEQVPGWQKIRVSGDAAYSVWDTYRRDYVWRTEKFEVEFAIVSGVSLKLDNVSFAGISRAADID